MKAREMKWGRNFGEPLKNLEPQKNKSKHLSEMQLSKSPKSTPENLKIKQLHQIKCNISHKLCSKCP